MGQEAKEQAEQQSEKLSSREQFVASAGFETGVHALRKITGEEVENLAENMTDEQLFREQLQLQDDSDNWDFGTLYRYNEIQYRRRAIQLEYEKNTTKKENQSEFIFSKQAEAYHQYLQTATQQMVEFMNSFEEHIDPILMSLPESQRNELLQKKVEAARYLMVLQGVMKERTVFAKLTMAEYKLGQIHVERPKPEANATPLEKLAWEEETKRQAQYTQKKTDLLLKRQQYLWELMALEEQRIVALPKTEEDSVLGDLNYADLFKDAPISEPLNNDQLHLRRARARQLDRSVVEILARTKSIPGMTEGFLPQDLYGDAMPYFYSHVLEQATAIADRQIELDEITEEKALEMLSEIRQSGMNQMILETNARGRFQLRMAEMLSTQKLIGRHMLLEGTRPAIDAETDDELRKALDQMLEIQKQQTIGYIENALEGVEKGFFDIPLDVRGKEAIYQWLYQDLTVKKVADVLGTIFAAPAIVPGFQKSLKAKLTDPLNDALLYDKDRERMLDPDDPEDQKLIKKRLEITTNLIYEFQTTRAVEHLQDTLKAMKALPPASKFAGGVVREELLPKHGVVTYAYVQERMDAGLSADEGATLIDALNKQKEVHWKEFMTAYEDFLQKVEKVIDVRLDLKQAMQQMKDAWEDVAKWYLVGAGVAAASPFLIWPAIKAVREAIKLGRRGAWGLLKNAGKSLPATAAFAAHGFRTYGDILAIGEHDRLLDQEKGAIAAEILSAGFIQDPEDKDTFTYTDGDLEIRVHLRDVTDPLGAMQREDYITLGRDVVQGGILAMAMKNAAFKKAILPYLLVEAGVEVIKAEATEATQLKAVSSFPPWLVARLHFKDNFEPAIGNSAHELLTSSSAESTKLDEDMRMKMLWSIFTKEVANIPEWRQAVFPAGANVVALKEYYSKIDGEAEGVFFDDVLPTFNALLYREYGTSRLPYGAIREGRIGTWWGTANFSYLEIRKVMQKAILLHKEDLAEARLVQAVVALKKEEIKDEPDTTVVSVLRSIVDSMEQEEVFTKPLAMLKLRNRTLEELMGYETRGKRIGAILADNARNRDRNEVNDEIAEVLEGTGFTFSSENILDLVGDDPVLRFNVDNVQPLTASEDVPIVRPDWFHELVPGQGYDDDIVNFGGRKMSKVHKMYYHDALRVVYETKGAGAINPDTSIAKAQELVTTGIAETIAAIRPQDMGFVETRGLVIPGTQTKKGVEIVEFNNPLTWKPPLEKLPPAFRELPVLAHFQETMPAKSERGEGESLVLSTVVMGDPSRAESMVVVQWAMVDWYFIKKQLEAEDFMGLAYAPIIGTTEEERLNALTNNKKMEWRARQFMVGQPVISSVSGFTRNERGGQQMIDYVIKEAKERAEITSYVERREIDNDRDRDSYNAEQAALRKMPVREFGIRVNAESARAARSTDAMVQVPSIAISGKKEIRTSILMHAYHPTPMHLADLGKSELFVIREDVPNVPVQLTERGAITALTFERAEVADSSKALLVTVPRKTLVIRWGDQEQFGGRDGKKPLNVRVPIFPKMKKELDNTQYALARSSLTTPFASDAPRWFHEHSIQTLLHQCVYSSLPRDKGFAINLQRNLIELYLTSFDKKRFLHKLFDELEKGKDSGILTPTTADTILGAMRSAVNSGEFRNSVRPFSPKLRTSVTLPGGITLTVLPIFKKVDGKDKIAGYTFLVLPARTLELQNTGKNAVKEIHKGYMSLVGDESTEGTTITIKDDKGNTLLSDYPFVLEKEK